MMLIKLGLRQCWLYKRQNCFNAVAIAINLAILIFYVGMFRGYVGDLRQTIIDFQTGDFQIHTQAYENEEGVFSLNELITEPDQLLSELYASTVVEQAGKRVEFKGMLGNGIDQAFVLGTGLNPNQDPQAKALKKAIQEGRIFRQGEEGILIGVHLARMLDVGVGDRVKVYARTQYNAHNLLRVPVIGIFEFGFAQLDTRGVFTSLGFADSFLMLEGGVTELMIRKKESVSHEDAALILGELYNEKPLMLRPWMHYAQGFVQEMRLNRIILSILFILLMALVIFSILNTVTMSLMDRTRELGTLRAIGFSPNQIQRMLVIEVTLIGVIGGVLGCLLGLGIDWYMVTKGIFLGPEIQEMATIPIKDSITSNVHYIEFVGAMIVAIFSTVLGGLKPILRIKKQTVSEMLSHHD